ncbi:serine/threonine-protein kinase SBK1-like [Tubulanus polymorphus]|uniref:serine/threonine-protein kinase SBK1-like n=1 Tax=Tubulanus polymorphus TaxID=672921 RepID=UPI003DA26482
MSLSSNSTPRSSISDTLQQIHIDDHYDMIRDLGNGTYGKVVLCVCKETGTEVALKMLPKATVSLTDFQREFTYSYYLSPHNAIVNTYDVLFETCEHYVFAQEKAPIGDLFDVIPPKTGLPEVIVKNVLRQLVSALDFMHSKSLVHRDIKPENILVFDKDCSKIKLMDFGLTRKSGIMVKKSGACIPYTPPEVCEAVRNERYCIEPTLDVWSTGVLMFCALTGNFPWERADQNDSYFVEFHTWQKRKTVKIPIQWKQFSLRLLRLFRRMLESKVEKRCSILEVNKYLDDSWTHHSKAQSVEDLEDFIVHEKISKNELSVTLKSFGVKTKLSPRIREQRVEEWLFSKS